MSTKFPMIFVIVLSHSMHAQNFTLHGRVTDLKGSPIHQAKIMLSQKAMATSTNENGDWIFGSTLSVGDRFKQRGKQNKLIIADGRIWINYQGSSILGRKNETKNLNSNFAQVEFGSRKNLDAAIGLDTIVVYWNSAARKRIPISSYSEIYNIQIDTAAAANDIVWKEKIKYGLLLDGRDGQIYRTVVFGPQTWMAENLNFNGTTAWPENLNNDSAAKFGRLYSWTTAMNIGEEYQSMNWIGDSIKHKGLCPEGWRIPVYTDWIALDNWLTAKNIEPYSGSNKNGTKIKSQYGWQVAGSTSGNGTDNYGMRITPGPGGYGATFLTSSNSRNYIWVFSLNYSMSSISWSTNFNVKSTEHSVRCVKVE